LGGHERPNIAASAGEQKNVSKKGAEYNRKKVKRASQKAYTPRWSKKEAKGTSTPPM